MCHEKEWFAVILVDQPYLAIGVGNIFTYFSMGYEYLCTKIEGVWYF